MSFWDIRRELRELVDERADVEQVGARVRDADHGDAPSPGELYGPGLWINPALVYPPIDATVFTRAPTSGGFYVKRPDFLVHEMSSRRAQIAPRLEAEARVLEQFREHPPHPTIVQYHGVLVVDDFIEGLVLDKLGDNLYGRVKATDAPPLDVTKVVRGVSDALKSFHCSLGYCHNDISPQNIAVKGGGGDTAVLLDFDSAKRIGEPIDRGNLSG